MSAIAFDDDIDRDTADPGIIPGGIRDRAMHAVLRRGPKGEDKEKTPRRKSVGLHSSASVKPKERQRRSPRRSDQHNQANRRHQANKRRPVRRATLCSLLNCYSRIQTNYLKKRRNEPNLVAVSENRNLKPHKLLISYRKSRKSPVK